MRQDELLALVAAVVVLLVLVGGGAAVILSRKKVDGKPETPLQPLEVREPGGGARRLAAGVRRRRQAARQASPEEDDDEVAPDNRELRPQATQLATRKDAYEERRRKKDEDREAQALAEEEEAARKEAERQAVEDAEAEKWLGQISIEAEGNEASEDAEQQGLLQAFVEYIKDRKTVVLEDLAAHFSLRVQDVINRVQSLESMGRITGVMDDRGKFIYISQAEMQAVADFIHRKGRVTVAELAAKSNTFIDLEEKAADLNLGSLDLGIDLEEVAEL